MTFGEGSILLPTSVLRAQPLIQLIRDVHNLPANFPRCAATIGNFDGVHRGHAHIIERLKQVARENNIPTLVITFEPQPNEYFTHKATPARLMRLREKLMALNTLGVDYVLCLRFNETLASLSAEDFVSSLLVDKLHIACVLVGDDFRFGYHRLGNIALLKQLGQKLGFAAENMPSYSYQEQRVSSSRIRLALEQGDIKLAEALLGRSYGISGKVAHGDKRGRTLGIPTANIFLHRKVVPVQGIYVVRTHGLLPHPVNGVANVGNRPTVGGGRTLLEVNLFDFNQDIYGRHIYVEFLHKLRDEEYYSSLELMCKQIFIDIENAKNYFRAYTHSTTN